MRTETTTRELFTFDELDERAKERARDWYREGIETDQYAEHVLEDAARMGALIGINITTRPVKLTGGGTRMEPNAYWDLDRGSFVSVAGGYSYEKGGAARLASEAPATWKDRETGEVRTNESNAELQRIAYALQHAQQLCRYRASATLSHGRESQNIEVWDATNTPTEDVEGMIEEALRDFSTWILSSLRAEYEYQNSDEAVDESIEANEYEFTAEGERA